MDIPCHAIIEAIGQELESLAVKEKELKAELAQTRARRKRGAILLAAAREFAGQASAGTGCARKEHLIPIIEDLLTSNEQLPLKELRGLTVHRLDEMGLSASGIDRSFRAAVSDPRFRTTEDGAVSFAKKAVPAVRKSS